MQNKFIYVFDINTRDKLLNSSYKLLKADEEKNIYVFKNKDEDLAFTENNINDMQFVFSNILTF